MKIDTKFNIGDTVYYIKFSLGRKNKNGFEKIKYKIKSTQIKDIIVHIHKTNIYEIIYICLKNTEFNKDELFFTRKNASFHAPKVRKEKQEYFEKYGSVSY